MNVDRPRRSIGRVVNHADTPSGTQECVPSSIRTEPTPCVDQTADDAPTNLELRGPLLGKRDFDSVATAMLPQLNKERAPTQYDDHRILEGMALVGYRYLQDGDDRVAQILFEGLCAVRPDWSYAHLARGVCAERLGQSAAARHAYACAARLDADDPQSRLNLAELLLQESQDQRAISLLRRVLGLSAATRAQLERARLLLKRVESQRQA